jgi:hypothetical protein
MSTETTRLDPERVEGIFVDCLFREEELGPEGESHEGRLPEDHVRVDGIVNHFAFHPGRVAEHADEVAALLAELPDEFKKSAGGGWSFLNACMDRHGQQWTGLHRTMEHPAWRRAASLARCPARCGLSSPAACRTTS